MFLTNVSLKRPVFITVVILALVVVGFVSFQALPLNEYPDIDAPYVSVTVALPGAGPSQVEAKVTKKIEDAMGQVSGTKHIVSYVGEGYSQTYTEFVLTKNSAEAVQEVRDKIGSIRGDLPQEAEEPVVEKINITARPTLSIAVSGTLPSTELSRLVDDTIVKRLNTVTGVGTVKVYGSQKREIKIMLDKNRLAAYGLTPAEVVSGLKNDNLDVPGGKISGSDKEITLRTYGSIDKVEDFSNILVSRKDGFEIRIGDIGRVVDGYKERTSTSFFNGTEAIGIDIIKQAGGNEVNVADAVLSELDDLKKNLPKEVKIDVVRDNSVSIRESVQSVQTTLVEGCILAVLIVFLFLGNFRITGISALALPTSILTTFIVMKAMNFSLNIMSLLGLSLAVGLLIDDAIVVIENIIRHMAMGKSPLQAAKEGTEEIGLAVMATTFAVVAVFLPMAMVSGVIGKFFVQFGLTVAFSVLVSLFVSFTLVPMMSSKYVTEHGKPMRGPLGWLIRLFNAVFDSFTALYAGLLRLVLKHRFLTMVVAVGLFVGSLMITPYLGSSFTPKMDKGQLTVEVNLDSGLPLQAAVAKTKEVEKILNEFKDVKYIYSTVQKDNLYLFVRLTDKQKRQQGLEEISNDMRNKLQAVSGVEIAVSPVSSMSEGKMLAYHIKGDDFEAMKKYADQVMKALQKTPGAVDISSSYKEGKPETRLEFDRAMAADLGVGQGTVADTIRTLFNGTVVTQYQTPKDRYDVRVMLAETQNKDLYSLDNIYVPGEGAMSGASTLIPIEQVTKKVFSTAASSINRYDRSREIRITANLYGTSVGTFDRAFEENIAKIGPVPAGVKFSVGGESESMNEGMGGLVGAMAMGVLFIFLILAAQFESFVDPLAIMFSLPLAIIGALMALFVTKSDLSVISMIGIIMLMGLVTKNAILLIDFAKQKMAEGMAVKEALIEAGTIRMRPILMTTFAMIFGMLPTAISGSSGSEMTSPMAKAIVGGLISSTLLTLVIVPVMYTLLDSLKKTFGFLKRKKVKVAENVSAKTVETGSEA